MQELQKALFEFFMLDHLEFVPLVVVLAVAFFLLLFVFLYCWPAHLLFK